MSLLTVNGVAKRFGGVQALNDVTFSSAERFTNRRMFWKVRAMPASATWLGFSPAMLRPAKMNEPASAG